MADDIFDVGNRRQGQLFDFGDGTFGKKIAAALIDGGAIIGKVLPREDPTFSDAVTSIIAGSGQTVVLPLAGYNGAVFAWTGTFAGVTLNFEASYDGGTTWVAVMAASIGGGASVTSIAGLSAPGAYEVFAPGATHLRVRSSAYTSGTMAVRAVPLAMAQDVAPSLAGGTITTVSTVSNLAAIAAGANLVGDVGLQPRATAGGLSSVARLLSAAASTNATSVKTSAGRLYKIIGRNAAAAARYLKLYNKASAPTVGTDTPVVTIALTPSAAFNVDLAPFGHFFSTGIAYAITTGSSDADTGALTAGDVDGVAIWYT